jgi:hypothetical protein
MKNVANVLPSRRTLAKNGGHWRNIGCVATSYSERQRTQTVAFGERRQRNATDKSLRNKRMKMHGQTQAIGGRSGIHPRQLIR